MGHPVVMGTIWPKSYIQIHYLCPIYFIGFVDENKNDIENIYYGYWLVYMIIAVWIPSIIMLITYGFIFNKLTKSIKSLPYLSIQSRIARSRRKVMQMLFVLLLLELICWAPWQIFTLYDWITYTYDLVKRFK